MEQYSSACRSSHDQVDTQDLDLTVDTQDLYLTVDILDLYLTVEYTQQHHYRSDIIMIL